MGMLRALATGIATGLALLAFVGVVIWAYGRGPRRAFKEAASLPLEEDDPAEKRPGP